MLTVKILGIEVLCPSEDLELLIVFTKLCCLRGREAELVDPLLEKLILFEEERVSFSSISSRSCSIDRLWWALTGGWDWMSPISRLTSSGFWWSTNTKEHCTKNQDQWVCIVNTDVLHASFTQLATLRGCTLGCCSYTLIYLFTTFCYETSSVESRLHFTDCCFCALVKLKFA